MKEGKVMFNFKNMFNKKNTEITVTSETATNDEFVAIVQPRLLRALNDDKLSQILKRDVTIAEHFDIPDDITKDELIYAFNTCSRLETVLENVFDNYNKLIVQNNLDEISFEKRAKNKAADKVFSATAIHDIIATEMANVKFTESIEIDFNDVDKLKYMLQNRIAAIYSCLNIQLNLAVLKAENRGYEFRGYI